jgi:putative spermidine/putrescine transport system permease protein
MTEAVAPLRQRSGTGLAVACLLGPAAALLIAFYAIPFLRMIAESLAPAGAGAGWMGMSLEHFERLTSSGRVQRAFTRTLRISGWVTLITLVISFPLALYLVRAGRAIRTAFLIALFVSLASSLIVRNYGWLVTLADAGPLNRLLIALGFLNAPMRMVYSEGATIVALVHYAIPFMTLPIFAALLRIPPSLSDSAASLGAPPWRVIRDVIWPLAMPGVFGGVVLTFALSMSAFVTPLMLGSPATAMISQVAAEQFLVQLAFPFGSAIVVALVLITFLIVVVFTLLVRKVFRAQV